MTAMDRLQIELSDVITFHNYDSPTELEKRINWLKRYNRPLICTEYMARGNGSFFMGSLLVGKVHNVGMINWGLVQGKSQTHLPWDSWERPYVDREPSVWFHEVFRTDGKPYIPEEVEFIKRMTGKVKGPASRRRAISIEIRSASASRRSTQALYWNRGRPARSEHRKEREASQKESIRS